MSFNLVCVILCQPSGNCFLPRVLHGGNWFLPRVLHPEGWRASAPFLHLAIDDLHNMATEPALQSHPKASAAFQLLLHTKACKCSCCKWGHHHMLQHAMQLACNWCMFQWLSRTVRHTTYHSQRAEHDIAYPASNVTFGQLQCELMHRCHTPMTRIAH